MLLNRSRLSEPVEMKQDIIHEFFHVLQFAHNRRATHDHGLSHWFIEASAVWAETWYDRSNSEIPHARFPTQFQTSAAGLELADIDHQYASYIWPFFMQQELSSDSVFAAWDAIGAVAPADFAGVTAAISEQLPFADNFREFAVRNLNISQVLSSARVPQYSDADSNFYSNSPPTHITARDRGAGRAVRIRARPGATARRGLLAVQPGPHGQARDHLDRQRFAVG